MSRGGYKTKSGFILDRIYRIPYETFPMILTILKYDATLNG